MLNVLVLLACLGAGLAAPAPNDPTAEKKVPEKVFAWEKHDGLNCWWGGHGADEIAGNAPGAPLTNSADGKEIHTLGQCQAECVKRVDGKTLEHTECHAVLFQVATGMCYGKKNVDVSKCAKDETVTLYMRPAATVWGGVEALVPAAQAPEAAALVTLSGRLTTTGGGTATIAADAQTTASVVEQTTQPAPALEQTTQPALVQTTQPALVQTTQPALVQTTHQPPDAADRTALLAWKDGHTANAARAKLDSLWVGDDHCTWTGVTCEDVGGYSRVTELEMTDDELELGGGGDENKLNGDIGALGSLTALTSLVLTESKLSGDIGNIGALGSLTALTRLELFDINLSGDIGALGSLTALTRLLLRENNVSGDIGALGSMTALTRLNLENNQLSGDIGALGSMTALISLYLSGNNLSGNAGNLPWGDMKDLNYIDLSNNQLSAPRHEICTKPPTMQTMDPGRCVVTPQN